ncbi:response regulator, partial [Paenibacillus sepulcri]|nr:response regulator [Paenibacillus sepulcri]
MYRLLIVDDEQIIVDGLHLLFQELNTIDLDINCAYDAHDAQKVASEMRIDIVLSDIAMPGMNGFELQQEITRQWPRCRFIFLSGYNDFQFIQSSLRGGAVDYVLKTEGDNAIIRAVEKTVRQIEAELQQEQLIGRARQQLQQTLPVLRREYLLELLEGAESTPESRSRRFRELAVPLQPAAPVILTVGRVDAWPENLHP